MTNQGLADRILPARGAAQKATANIAEQLTDSPGRSDGDSSNPFREPTHRTKSVKYRYSATGKHLSSPLKGGSSSPETKLAMSNRTKRPTDTPAPSSRAVLANLPAVATTSRKRKASIRKESSFLSSPSPLSSVPTSPALSTTALPPPPSTLPAPAKRLVISKTLSLRSVAPGTFTPSLSPDRKQRKTKTEVKKEGWDIGNSVWVLVNQSGVLVDNAVQPQSDVEPFMWWPAQIVQNQPLRVSMFGEFPSSSSTSKGLCTIFAPSSSNVQSINDDSGAKRFSRATFCLTCTDNDVSPPAKKPRLDEAVSIEDKWETAVQSMEKAFTLERDGLPALLSSYAAAEGTFDDSDPDTSGLRQHLLKSVPLAPKKPKPMNSTKKLKAQRSRVNLRDESGSTPRGWSPCPPDPTLQIPGELVLAMAPKTGGSYWPAQILEHIPARKEKYKVKFLDDEQHVIAREWFWTSEEEGFVRCTLGEWESAVKTVEDPESGDEDDDTNTCDADGPLPPPPPAGEFEELSLHAQLAYVKPVLQAILNKGYAPAAEKHEAFMGGGQGRTALLKSAGVRGGMDARFVKGVQKAICEWVLGDKKPNSGKLEVEDVMSELGKTGEATFSPSGVVSVETLPRDSTGDYKMEGIESAVVPGNGHADKMDSVENGPPSLSTSVDQMETIQDFKMVVDEHEQQTASSPPPTNGAPLSPVVKQGSLVPKSQLDLLAEVSQAVATEPSLLPSHPELPKLKVDLLDTVHRDTSSQPSPLTPVPEEGRALPCRRDILVVCEDFESLTAVEKLDYCLNILLPESIQQILLWRSGERTCAELLPPEEEQRLHDVGARKAAETDWVDDVMRLRAAQARLWAIDLDKKPEEKKVEGGTRSRPRRGTVSRP